jgi:hypothetical protein
VADILSLITASFSADETEKYASYILSTADMAALAAVGRDLLQHLMPGACTVMTALYSVLLEKSVSQRAYVTVGSLFIGDVRVFGEDGEIDGKRFSQSSPSWDGHAWVMLGDYIADASLFRTARSGKGHPTLGPHVEKEFGPTAGLMICKAADTELSGLQYEARYVLTQKQVDGLARGAMTLIGASS